MAPCEYDAYDGDFRRRLLPAPRKTFGGRRKTAEGCEGGRLERLFAEGQLWKSTWLKMCELSDRILEGFGV